MASDIKKSTEEVVEAKEIVPRKIVITFTDGENIEQPATVTAEIDGYSIESEEAKAILASNSAGVHEASPSIHLAMHCLGFLKYMLTKDEGEAHDMIKELPESGEEKANDEG